MTLTVMLDREKETRNKVRFAEMGDAEHVGMVYVPKSTLHELGDPERLELTLAPA
jgi:hypothetical protein